MLLVLIIGVASVSASDDNESIQATDESADAVSIANETLTDSRSSELSTNSLGATNDEESYSSSESDEVLAAADGTFTDLYNKVKNGGTVTLDRNYVYTASTDSAYVNGIILNKATAINGNGYTINCKNAARAFYVNATNVVIKGITFTNGYCTGYGSNIRWAGNNGLLENCNFYDGKCWNSGSLIGGAVHVSGSYNIIRNCKFNNNVADHSEGSIDGGAMSVHGTYNNITNCEFTNNIARGAGGAIHLQGHYNTVSDSRFINNTAKIEWGGAILFWDTNNKIKGCYFEGNKATPSSAGGGAVAAYYANSTIDDCTFVGNSAVNGGAVRVTSSGAKITNCKFINNTASGNGGAVGITGNNANVEGCSFEGNHANDGGAIHNSGTGSSVSDITVFNNTATTNPDVSSTQTIEIQDIVYGVQLAVNVKEIIAGETLSITADIVGAKSGAVIDIKDNGNKIGTITVNNNKFTYNYGNVAAGNHVISLGTKDTSGNTYEYNTNSFSFRAVPNTSYSALQILINRATASSTLTLTRSYSYTSAHDSALVGGIKVNKTLVIKGAGYTIDGKNAARTFEVSASGVTIENAKLVNGKSTSNGGAVYWTGANGILKSITFTNNAASNYKNVYTTQSSLKIYSSSFPGVTVTLTANPTSSMYGNNIALSGTVNDGTNVAKSLSILSGSTTVATASVSASGTFSTTWTKPAAGNYTLTLATTDANSNTYTFTQPTVKVEIKQYTTDFTVTVTGSKVQEDVTITVNTGKTDATGTVDVLFNGKITKLTLSNGKASMNVGKLAADSYSVTATYSGDAKYQRTEKGTTFTITKYATTTTLTLTNVNVGNKVPVVATVTSSAPFAVNGKIILVGAQGNKTININNGQGNLDITGLPAGRYVVSCTIER